MSVFLAEVTGISPLMMHRWEERQEDDGGGTRPMHIPRRDPRTEAEAVAYRHPDGFLYLPGAAIARMLIEAGGSHKDTRSKKSLKWIIPAACILLDDAISLRGPDQELLTDFEVDSRPVVIPSTKGRIMRHRPKVNPPWLLVFSIDVNLDLIDPATVHQMLTEGGLRLGIGDFRPEKRGPFGRFQVTRWEELTRAERTPELRTVAEATAIPRKRRVA
jgi:hypothetical protein